MWNLQKKQHFSSEIPRHCGGAAPQKIFTLFWLFKLKSEEKHEIEKREKAGVDPVWYENVHPQPKTSPLCSFSCISDDFSLEDLWHLLLLLLLLLLCFFLFFLFPFLVCILFFLFSLFLFSEIPPLFMFFGPVILEACHSQAHLEIRLKLNKIETGEKFLK